MDARPSADGTPTDKGTLFCASCPHQGRYDSEWTIVETDHSVHYLCPNCGTEIATRRLTADFDSLQAACLPPTDGGCR